MGKLTYAAICSLDGYVADAEGNFDWSAPDEEVHSFVNDLERPVGTYLFGRRMYEVLSVWDTYEGESASTREYAQLWRDSDKVVYSRTLDTAPTARTRLEREFDPAAVQELKARADRDIAVGGPELASQALRAGLVDECHFFLVPVIVGGGKRAFPDGLFLELELRDERRFANGTVYVRYGVGSSSA